MSEEPSNRVVLPVHWDFGVELPTIYANQFVITFASGDEFQLIFGVVVPPIILDPKTEPLPANVSIRPVARIVVTPKNMVKFAEAIQTNIQQYQKAQEIDQAE